MGGYCLGEAFVVTNLVKEIVTIDDNDSPILRFSRPVRNSRLSMTRLSSNAPTRSRRKISPYCWYKSIYEFVGASLSIEARFPKNGILLGCGIGCVMMRRRQEDWSRKPMVKRITYHVEGLYTSSPTSTTSECNFGSSEWIARRTEWKEEKQFYPKTSYSDTATFRGRNHRRSGLQGENLPHKSTFVTGGKTTSAVWGR